jgi:hypothetical protein
MERTLDQIVLAVRVQALRKELPGVLGEFWPEACLYAAGMDVSSGTPNPLLRLRVPDIEKGEAFVFEALSSRQVPVARLRWRICQP